MNANRVILKPWSHVLITNLIRPNGMSKKSFVWIIYFLIRTIVGESYAAEVYHELKRRIQ